MNGLAQASEGMWTLDNLPLKKMQAEYGFSPGPEWSKHVMQSALRIAGGCSASFISKNGLVMTNHHCASECVEQLSTAKKDFIRHGFLAKSRAEELVCPNFEMNRLDAITDVTDQVKAATAKLEGSAYKQARNAIQAQLTSACVGGDSAHIRCDLVDLYHGGRFQLYKYRRFTDARLVWAPEKAAAFLGGDLDNFSFPRYNLDITLLRLYENGKPVAVKDFFPFNADGAKEGEIVFVAGHPGSTERQHTVAQLEATRDQNIIPNLIRESELRGTIAQFMRSSPEANRIAHENLFYLENDLKARQGRLKTLQDPEVMRLKQQEEAALREYVAKHPEFQHVAPAWDAIASALQAKGELAPEYQALEKGHGFECKYFALARHLVRSAIERSKPNAERLPEYADARLPEIELEVLDNAPVYPHLETVNLRFALEKMREQLGPDHEMVKQILGKTAPSALAWQWIRATKLADVAQRKKLWRGDLKTLQQSTDPFIKLALMLEPKAREVRARFEKEVESVIQKNTALIAQVRFARDGLDTYPDATFSLRLSYGTVKGWQEGKRHIHPLTFIDGAFARDTGSDPFALPPSWHAARAKLNLQQPMNFVTDTDIIGGNSGSPMFNRKGEIIGLVFDSNIPGLGGAYWFDQRSNRTVAVHSGMIIEALQNIYHAPALVREISGQ
jgi:hypothetical protein